MDQLLNADDNKKEVSSFLSHLTREDIISLGEALGLKKETMQPMSEMPGDMVEAWLKMKDNVYDDHREPTWNSLAKGLKKANQMSLAKKITRQPSGEEDVDTSEQQASNIDHTESDRGRPFASKKSKGSKVDTTPVQEIIHGAQVQDRQGVDLKPEKIQKPATDRGQYKAKLLFSDKDDEFTEITPDESDSKPYSPRGFYDMKSERHGVALIINNKYFRDEGQKTRHGTNRDEHNLSETWQFLGYHVVIMRNCTRDKLACTFRDIDDLLEKAQSSEKVANDSFVCCIMSHGDEGIVYGSDSKPLEYARIQMYLARCKSLCGKPKMLFLQACSGSRLGSLPIEDYLQNVGADGDTGTITISEYTDFYLSYASVGGDMSYRDTLTGSWFITELCKTLCKFSKVMDLDDMQKEVNKEVVTKYKFVDHYVHMVMYKQQPRGVDQLRWKVFFFQK